jgi:hypothetical protein
MRRLRWKGRLRGGDFLGLAFRRRERWSGFGSKSGCQVVSSAVRLRVTYLVIEEGL